MVSSSSTSLKRQRQRVIVIGAGISGLACAKELQQRGYQVLVIEARQRIGGRLNGTAIETADVSVEKGDDSQNGTSASPSSSCAGLSSSPPLHIDLGGALIHGILDNPVHSLVQQMGIPVLALSDTLLLDSHGWPVDAARDEKISTLFNECLEQSFSRISQALATGDSQKSAHLSTTARSLRLLRRTAHRHQEPESRPVKNSLESTANEEAEDGDKKRSACHVPLTDSNATLNEPEKIDDDIDDDNYGRLFRQVCRDKNIATENNALWKWHQFNLEVSCGASFDQLGYTWNEDEAYGFDGDHVALSTSWKSVVEGLADGLEILMASQVTRICRVDSKARQVQRQASRPTRHSSPNVSGPVSEVVSPMKQKQPPLSFTPSPSWRRSRRLMGEDANVRRSERATKGQLVGSRLNVSNLSSWSYDGDTGHTPSSTLSTKRRRLSPDSSHFGEPSSTQAQVTLSDGTVLEADAVVCTLPLAILKIPPGKPGHVEFYPSLPRAKQEAIEKLGCGILNKCVLSFPRIFWQDVDFLGLASEQRRPYLIVNAAKYTTDHKPVLIFMYGGAFAREIEDWRDCEIVDDCMVVLRALFGQHDVVPDPLDYIVTRWGKEQFSRMAFSYIPPSVDGMQELEVMSEPIYDSKVTSRPVIMFAGEHTNPFHPSTIHGAFLSGIREAYRLDLAMEPDANGNLVFSGDQMYRRTFNVRRKFRGANIPDGVPPSQSPLNSNALNGVQKVRHRRRCIAGAMALRRNPKTVLKEENTLTSGGLAASRRSQRSAARRQLQCDETMETDSPGHISRYGKFASIKNKLNVKVDLQALEDRTLVRSVESYGRDFVFIRSKVLPVHGSSRRKSNSQLRTRYQALTKSAAFESTKSDHAKAFWEAKEPFHPPVPLVADDHFASPDPRLVEDRRTLDSVPTNRAA